MSQRGIRHHRTR